MAELPRYTSQRALTTQQPAPLRRGDSPGAYAAAALGALAEITARWQEATVTAQLNAFRAQKGVFLNDLKNRAALEADPNAFERYNKELEDYRKGAFKDMSPRAKAEASLELQTDSQLAFIQLRSMFQKKTIAQAQQNLIGSLEGYKNEILSAPTPDDASKIFFQAYSQIDDNVRTGIISPDEGKRRKEQFNDDVRLAFIDNVVWNDPKNFLKNLDNYTFKDEQEKSKKVKEARTKIEADKKLEDWKKEQVFTAGADTLGMELLKGKLTPEMVKGLLKNGQIDNETATIWFDILSGNVQALSKEKERPKVDLLLSLLEDTLGDDRTKTPLDIMKKAARMFKNNGLTDNQYAFFVHSAKERFQQLRTGLPLGDRVKKAAFKALRSFSSAIPRHPADASMFIDFIGEVQAGKAPDAAAAEIIEISIERMLEEYNITKKITVRRKSDGQVGILSEKDFNPETYERVE